MSVPTSAGEGRVHLAGGGPTAPVAGLLCLGHGAGGNITAPDLQAVRAASVEAGWTVALVEQPYRVGGRRAQGPAPQLDAAWTEIVAALRADHAGPLVVGGRSSGARIACRTAVATGAAGAVCLAFPLRPPQRPEQSRAAELAAVGVPVLVVQGERDPFGGPDELRAEVPAGPEVVGVRGDHALRAAAAEVGALVAAWLSRFAG
ncbi:MAG TPA: alpha/beta family hydrolase [Mycobacteriales bacterium]|nr:alpha/beta family hydrolase [Mycobacteriales bacterium]